MTPESKVPHYLRLHLLAEQSARIGREVATAICSSETDGQTIQTVREEVSNLENFVSCLPS